MPSDLSIVVADQSRMKSIRDGLHLPGRMMHFHSGTLAQAIEAVRTHQPKVVAVDALFVQTLSGAAFVDRVDALPIPGITVRLITQHEGRWVTTPRTDAAIATPSQPAVVLAPRPVLAAPQPMVVVPPKELVASVPNALAAAEQMAAAVNTRRAPRFPVRNPLDAIVESGPASLIDISVLGAQILSQPTLRPNQKIKLALPDTDDVLNVIAMVAWSTFEISPSTAQPQYRAGIEFAGAAQRALEEYRLRHCAEQPLKPRS